MTSLPMQRSSETSGQTTRGVSPTKTTKIFGPPGTGKTTWLLTRLEEHLRNGYTPSQVSFISFTKSAVLEARSRIEQRFTSSSWQKNDFDGFQTLHATCYQSTGSPKKYVFDRRAAEEFSVEENWDLTLNEESPTDHDLILRAYHMSRLKKTEFSQELIDSGCPVAFDLCREFVKEYEAFKEKSCLVDFTDMLLERIGKGSLGKKIVMLDEAQDLTPLQLDLVVELAGGCDYFYLAGDDDQAIYSFQGADMNGFLNFPADETIHLKKSHRVPEEIGRKAAFIIKKVEKREFKNANWADGVGDFWCEQDWRELGWNLADGKDVFVLCRHVRLVAVVRQHLLERYGVLTLNGDRDSIPDNYRTALHLFKQHKFEGKELSPDEWYRIYMALGKKFEATQIRKKISVPPISWGDFRKHPKYGKYYELIKHDPLKKPTIRVGTMHWAKGREADTVVLLSDCNYRVYKNMDDTERRLCYVAMTRARKKLIVCRPDSRRYLEPLMEL